MSAHHNAWLKRAASECGCELWWDVRRRYWILTDKATGQSRLREYPAWLFRTMTRNDVVRECTELLEEIRRWS